MNASNETNSYSDHIKVREVYNYDPDTGVFTFRVQRGPKRAGEVAGGVSLDGYIYMKLNGNQHLAHRLAFLYMTGKWPEKFVDHKDTNRSNNAWDNLREATKTVNARNRSKLSSNTSGHVGVSWDKLKCKWVAHIGVDSKCIRLGRFDTIEEAVNARAAAETKYGYDVDKVWDKL